MMSGDRMRAEVLGAGQVDHSVRTVATEYNKNIAGWKLSSRGKQGRPFTPRAYTNTQNPQQTHGGHIMYATTAQHS